MTSETEALKTNEFQRRRKLRIQQVREQSKEIARRIRQRAKIEKLRHIGELDKQKEKEYFKHQEKLVKRLEQLYSDGLQNIGSGHRNATEKQQEDVPVKIDLSKKRAREAAAELRRKKQEKLDEQKKILDRKLQARETANEISREKSSSVANKLLGKSIVSKSSEKCDDKIDNNFAILQTDKESNINEIEKSDVVTCDMATQWNFEELPNEWEPHIPELSLPKDDKDSLKESTNRNADSKAEKSKKINLFALSDEMPSSLRGGLTSVPEETVPQKPSLTLVSEYLQNRGLRLRESDPTSSKKMQINDLQSIKQTIYRTRSSKPEVNGNSAQKPSKSNEPESALSKKQSVMMYNHSTRDTKDVPYIDKKLVVRDLQTEDDAYSQAMRESTSDNSREKEHQKKLQEMRHKIAMTKQSVEKEYKDTINFLNALPKDKSKPIKNAYMDAERQQLQKETRQRKMQQEFKKIEKECKKQEHLNFVSAKSKHQSKSKSPVRLSSDDDFNSKDFQYSWMPVPESDGNLAIHTIPTTLKEGKAGSTVKFSKVDSYHEYRSRHKHTPPTRDTMKPQKNSNKHIAEAVVIEQNDETTDSSVASDTSSVENLQIDKTKEINRNTHEKLSDAERIIIYKILDSTGAKKNKEKKHSKILKDIAKSLSSIDKKHNQKTVGNNEENLDKVCKHKVQNLNRSKHAETRVSFDQLNEGIYKKVTEKGDNIATMYFSDSPREGENIKHDVGPDQICSCSKKNCEDQKTEAGVSVNWESGDDAVATRSTDVEHKSATSKKHTTTRSQPSEVSFSSFKTATNDKAHVLPDGFIRLMDEGGKDAGKFYIGATGFLKDDDYEVIIQLRKKDGAKEESKATEKQTLDLPIQEIQKVNDKLIFSEIETQKDVKDSNPEYVDPNNMQHQNTPVTQITSDENESSHDQADVENREQIMSSSISSNNMSTDEQFKHSAHLSEKGMFTPFQLSYAIPSNVKKSDSVPRPATSAFTQTTLDSPDQRPLFVHMSSSTSTAYMSPPELILPKFLKHDYKITYDETCDLTQNSNLNDGRIEILNRKTVTCEEYADCNCQRCTHAKRVFVNKPTSPIISKEKLKPSEHKINTPSNTFINNMIEQDNEKYYTSDKKRSRCSSPVSKNVKIKCHRDEKPTPKTCLKNQAHNRRNNATNKRSSSNVVLRVNSNVAATYKGKNRNNLHNKNKQKNRQCQLNPIVKSYVDKLLCLNKQSVRALEVINQECSSVTTPGSSIIEVPHNTDANKPAVENKISLEHIKEILMQQILQNIDEKQNNVEQLDTIKTTEYSARKFKPRARVPRKKSLHKVKSLNISKHIFKNKSGKIQEPEINTNSEKPLSSSSSTKADDGSITKSTTFYATKMKARSKSSPSPRNVDDVTKSKIIVSDVGNSNSSIKIDNKNDNIIDVRRDDEIAQCHESKKKSKKRPKPVRSQSHTSTSSESARFYIRRDESTLNISTQTSRMIDSDINFMKLAENKLQNMEKIADLTEKCTKRLSNLAKVLEEVRKNKSLAYSQITDSASDSERISTKVITQDKPPTPSYDPLFEIQSPKKDAIPTLNENKQTKLDADNLLTETTISTEISNLQEPEKNIVQSKSNTPDNDPYNFKIVTGQNIEKNISQSTPSDDVDMKIEIETTATKQLPETVTYPKSNISGNQSSIHLGFDQIVKVSKSPSIITSAENKGDTLVSTYIPFLANIPKPMPKASSHFDIQSTSLKSNNSHKQKLGEDNSNLKNRGKPPPALSRMNLKDLEGYMVPHELSTVLEVDSPMSVKVKGQPVYNDSKGKISDVLNSEFNSDNKEIKTQDSDSTDQQINPDILLSNIKLSRRENNTSSNDSSDESKIQMMDLKQFNEIMLKPFISIQEYAKQCNIEVLDEGSNIEEIPRDGLVHDDVSSLHSDGSLPDVIAELLKRNIINEPFKFETTSNPNSTSVSSESTLSVLALSKVRKEKKKSTVSFQNKENIGDTSDTLSISSNPDLENAFKKLGMGWASSTLKKTKERLALSSSSNTSSSSMSQFKLKSFKNQDIPNIVSDSVSSVLDTSKKPVKNKNTTDSSRNVEQQTSQMNSMTVKEFLTNELAKKITFTNKSNRNDTEEFMSLYETKMPEEMKHSSQMIHEERSIDSGPNGNNSRARTSTPVQLFKSMTYHSSSSSNVSNGLFSNAEDLSSVKGTSNSMRNHSTSDKDDLTIPNYSLRKRRGNVSDCSKSD